MILTGPSGSGKTTLLTLMGALRTVQEGSLRSGQEVTRLLGAVQSRVLDVLDANRTLDGTVQMMTDLAVTPFQRDLEDNTWLFTNEIALKAELTG